MDIKRKAYDQLKAWKNSSVHSKAIMIEGARRVGKSYLAEHFGEHEYDTVLQIDFSSPIPGTKKIFQQYGNRNSLDEFFNQLSVLYSVRLIPHHSLIIFDEIQKYPKARELIKHLVADDRFDYIETGSLISIKKNVKDILIPSEEENMRLFPLDFEEFLDAIGEDVIRQFLEEHYQRKEPLGNILKKANEVLRLYMIVGGMPQAVDAYAVNRSYDAVERVKRSIIRLYREDIAKYAEGYVAEATAVFDAIPSQLSHHDKKIKFASLRRGSRYSNYIDALNWIQESMVGNLCHCQEEPSVLDGFLLQPEKVKCYMADTGLLLTLASGENYLRSDLYKSIVLGKMSANQGMMVENLVSQMIAASGRPLRFYEKSEEENGSRRKYEVDFLLRDGRKSVPVEVKSGNTNRHPSLDYFCARYKRFSSQGVILTKGDYREENGYRYIPLAYTPFFLSSLNS